MEIPNINFTFVPVWVLQDAILLIAAIIITFFIIKKERNPVNILLEMICFSLLYAAVYENFATMMGWYGYGRSLIMVFNVPISVPIVEYLIVYSALRMLKNMEIPVWCKPFIAGFFGMIFDFTLDPLAIKQIFATKEGIIGRWTWFPGPHDAVIYGEPVYNFSGWMLLCAYAALFFLLGRWWFKKSNYKPVVGYIYPIPSMLGALVLLVGVYPLSRFLLWLEPFFQKGSVGEWIMLIFYFAASLFILTFFWRGRMKGRISFKEDLPLFIVFICLPFLNVIFTIAGGFFNILWMVAGFAIFQIALFYFIYSRTKKLIIIN